MLQDVLQDRNIWILVMFLLVLFGIPVLGGGNLVSQILNYRLPFVNLTVEPLAQLAALYSTWRVYKRRI